MRQLKIGTRITIRSSDAIETYLQDITKLEMITPEEEVILAQKIQAGDQRAFDRLVQANLRFVVSVAKQYQHQGLDLDDLINEGNLGLMKAAQRFDHTRGFKFISYAVWWIRQSILEALAETSRAVRLPQNQIAKYNFVSKKALAFLQDNEYEPSIEELMEITDLPEREIQTTMMVATRARSLDEVVPNSEELTLVDTLRNNETEATDLHVMHESLQKDIRRALKMLGDRTAEILTAYFGLDGPDGQTIEQVMSKYDLTKERIRQIKERAIGRLRKSSQAPRLKAYLG